MARPLYPWFNQSPGNGCGQKGGAYMRWLSAAEACPEEANTWGLTADHNPCSGALRSFFKRNIAGIHRDMNISLSISRCILHDFENLLPLKEC